MKAKLDMRKKTINKYLNPGELNKSVHSPQFERKLLGQRIHRILQLIVKNNPTQHVIGIFARIKCLLQVLCLSSSRFIFGSVYTMT